MHSRSLAFTVLIGLLLIFSRTAHAADQIKIGGGGGTLNSMFSTIAEVFEQETNIKLLITPSTPEQGLLELDAGLIDLSCGFEPFDSLMRHDSVRDKKINAASFQEHVLGEVRIVVIVHKKNLIKSLTKEQLKGIFTGKITNWNVLGGEDLSIVVVWGNTPGQNAVLTKAMLDNEPVTGNSLKATDYADIRARVSNTPGAIGIVPEGFVAPIMINVPDIPRLTALSYALTKGEPSPKIQKLFKFVSDVNIDLKY